MKANKTRQNMSFLLLTVFISLFYSCNNTGKSIIQDEEYIIIQGGTFQMGKKDGNQNEQLVHTVILNDFEIGKHEVTNTQYCEFLNSKENNKRFAEKWVYLEYTKIEKKDSQYLPKPGFENHPIVSVSWEGATAFANWKGARLPTEAEWEFAARGGNLSKGYIYSGSNQIEDVAWFDDNSGNKTHPVGQKKPNELGIYDMSGNVWEWCNDWYSEDYYGASPSQNPKGPDTGTAKVMRGGELQFNEIYCRVDNRYNISPNARNTRIGFRLARNL